MKTRFTNSFLLTGFCLFLCISISYSLYSQNVGIGITSPVTRLHVGGAGASLRVDNGPLLLYNTSTDEFTQLSVSGNFSILQNNYVDGAFLFRPGTGGLRDVIVNGTGISIVGRGPISAAMGAQVPLDIRTNGESVRLNGATPYISLYDADVQRGYLQAWTDGIALASVGHDVGLWTNSVKRLAIKPNGALEINGSTGSAGQVLTSNGAGAPPSWGSPNTALYNSFRFHTLSQVVFTCTSDDTWRDIPGMSSTLVIAGNTYVDVSTNMCYAAGPCIGCDNPVVEFRLVINNTNNFCFMRDRTGGTEIKTKSITTGFTLPAGTHTLKWQMRCNNGSDVTVINSDLRATYPSFMRIWTVSQ